MPRAILVVDDDHAVRKALKAILSRAGFAVSEALDGAEALQKVRRDRFDLITMDMAMRGIDGIDTISILRSETGAPVLAISGNLTDDVRADLRSRDVYHMVPKPFTQEQVLSAVYQALGEA